MTMRHKDFAAFILSHGRPNTIKTLASLKRSGYTGKVYIIIDNEDATASEYHRLYGDQVIVFDKAAIAQTFDECDNFKIPRKSVVYARNACYPIARELGLKTFVQLDDDYTEFEHRFNALLEWEYQKVRHLDAIFDAMLDFYLSIPAKIIAFAQGGDLIGGRDNTYLKSLNMQRKAMNTLFCHVDRPMTFTGRINEDVNSYCIYGFRGDLLLTVFNVNIKQIETQKNTGGMSDTYLSAGTYLKSFYTVMNCPSFVTIADMGEQHRRIHHRINRSNAYPVILSEQYRKP